MPKDEHEHTVPNSEAPESWSWAITLPDGEVVCRTSMRNPPLPLEDWNDLPADAPYTLVNRCMTETDRLGKGGWEEDPLKLARLQRVTMKDVRAALLGEVFQSRYGPVQIDEFSINLIRDLADRAREQEGFKCRFKFEDDSWVQLGNIELRQLWSDVRDFRLDVMMQSHKVQAALSTAAEVGVDAVKAVDVSLRLRPEGK